MLNKPSTPITSRSAAVKKLTRVLAISACFGTIGLASSAHASSDQLVDRVIEVKIKTAELNTQSGVIAVYDKLKTKAERECKNDKATLKYLDQTVDQCAQDLLGQFVESSKVESLQGYHRAETSTETQTLAMNMATSLQN